MAVWDRGRPGARPAAVAAARRPQRVADRLRVERRAAAGPPSAPRAASRCATRACAPSSCAFTTTTGAATSRWSRRCATRSGRACAIMVDANQGWRMAGDLHAALGRRDRARMRPGARAARRRMARGAAAAPTTSTGTRPCAGRRRCGSPPARWCATAHAGPRPGRARRRRRDPARRRARGRDRRRPPDRGPGRSARPDVVAAHLVERLRPGRQPARRARVLDLPVRRGAVRPAGLAGGTARLAAAGAGRDRRRRHDPPAGRARASASSPTWTPSSATGWHERRRRSRSGHRCSSATARR